ncbi:MAG: transposase [Bacteroidota bacterium]
MVFTAVVYTQGFLKHSRIYEVNIADVTTLEDRLDELEAHAGPTEVKKTVVMDAGMASDANLSMVQAKGYHYVCVSRHRIKEEEIETDQHLTQWTYKGKQPVKLKVFQTQRR